MCPPDFVMKPGGVLLCHFIISLPPTASDVTRPNSPEDQSEPFGLASKRYFVSIKTALRRRQSGTSSASKRHFISVKTALRQRRGRYLVVAAKSNNGNHVTDVTFLILNMHILLREGDFDTVRIQRVVNGAEHLTDD